MSRSSSPLALVEALPYTSTDVGDTSLDLYRQSEEAGLVSRRKSSGLEALVAPETSSKICVDAWAIRHRLVHVESGTSLPMRCNRYTCLYCGPRRVAMWRNLIELAEPERFITLTRVADDLATFGTVLRVFWRRVRRLGYRAEYLTTFERHKHCTTSFHAHILQKGDYIPQSVISDCLRTATHGRSWVCDIRRADGKVAGYVTKYVTKELTSSDAGQRADGMRARPNRVRYSKGFFSAGTASLREYLRGEWVDEQRERGEEPLDLDGQWCMVQEADWPRDLRGRIDPDASREMYLGRVANLFAEVGTEAKMARGGLMVLRYMLSQDAE